VNEEVRDLFAAGVDIVQLDEPYVQARPEAAREYAVEAIDRALRGATGTTALHVCFGYGKHVANKPNGYAFCEELNACAANGHFSRMRAAARGHGTAAPVAVEAHSRRRARPARSDRGAAGDDRAADRDALKYLPPERLVVAPDCGMKYLPRDVSVRQAAKHGAGRDIVRAELNI
jgi:5-methyltetrahydropteroyltriglutamate--homocysteine methyltransferase